MLGDTGTLFTPGNRLFDELANPRGLPMMVVRGQTANFVVSYDDTLANGVALADAVLARCEPDLAAVSALFGGIMPAAASLPFRIDLVPGGGGASHPGCLATEITCFISAGSDTLGVPGLVVAEVAEVFMATQAKGFDCAASNGEALSRVMPTVLYPNLRDRFSTGNEWLNSTNPSRPDWVNNTEPTDQDLVSIGCGSLFLNYLADQLNFAWPDIINAAAPTLGATAANLGLPNAFEDFSALLARHFPAGVAVNLPDDDPFPLPDPSLYLRHNLADDGTSHAGPLSVSPDIIVKNQAVAGPQATFSTAASIASDHESDANVLAGQDNFVYLRVWNRGIDATDAVATAYWSPPATLVTPSLWNLIGSAPFPDVPPGRVVRVSDPGITWSQADIPAPGHYCFVATVGNADDPAPAPATFRSFDDFVKYILAHNNITWRNFNVVASTHHRHEGPFSGYVPLPFHITGAWDEARTFALETVADLPPGSRLALQVSHQLGSAFRAAYPDCEEHEDADADQDDRRRIRIPLPPHGRHLLGRIDLPAASASASHLLVQIPPARRDRPHEVAIIQMYEGQEVGRITWRLVPSSPSLTGTTTA
jgi:hypothetical protein